MLQGLVVAQSRGVLVEDRENEGGSCPTCSTSVTLWTCCECGTSTWVIDCAHRLTPSWLRRGRRDGSERARIFCGDCADVLPPREARA
jgi:hypothetical protein